METKYVEKECSSYPTLKKINSNSYYAGLLQNIYAGADSELECFLQLRYQQYILSPYYEDVSNLLKHISREDLKHQELLADAIIKLGGNPFYINAQGGFFTSRCVDYIKNLSQIFLIDIEKKEKAIIDYRTIIQKVSNQDLTIMLERILKDEELHLELLKEMKTQLKI